MTTLRDRLAQKELDRYNEQHPATPSSLALECWLPGINDLADEIEAVQARVAKLEGAGDLNRRLSEFAAEQLRCRVMLGSVGVGAPNGREAKPASDAADPFELPDNTPIGMAVDVMRQRMLLT